MVDVLMPFLSPFKKLVLCIGWNSDEKIAVLKQPILLISGMIITKLVFTVNNIVYQHYYERYNA